MIVRNGASMKSKILDFGIARLLEGSIFDATTFGRQLGSLFYMSPEQTRGEPADARSDVFGLASILFEILTLHRTWARAEGGYPLPAFAGPVPHGEMNSIAAVFTRISLEARPRPTDVRPALPQSFDRIVQRALAVNPNDRFQSVDQLVGEMREAFLQLSDFETRTEHGPPLSAVPKATVDDDETRVENAAGPEDATQLLEASDDDFGVDPTEAADHRFGVDLTEAAPTDKKPARQRRSIPETLEYRGARPATNLEEAGPTVRASGPIQVTTPDREAFDSGLMDVPLTRSVEQAAATLVDPSESGEVARAEYLPPTGEMNNPTNELKLPPTRDITQNLRLPLLVGAFVFAVALAAVGTVVVQTLEEPAPIKVEPLPPKPKTTSFDFSEIDRLLDKVKKNPADEPAIARLKERIAEAAAEVPDAQERQQIEKIAELSSYVRNVEGLESAVDRLKTALEEQ
jgi:hypothetical protein